MITLISENCMELPSGVASCYFSSARTFDAFTLSSHESHPGWHTIRMRIVESDTPHHSQNDLPFAYATMVKKVLRMDTPGHSHFDRILGYPTQQFACELCATLVPPLRLHSPLSGSASLRFDRTFNLTQFARLCLSLCAAHCSAPFPRFSRVSPLSALCCLPTVGGSEASNPAVVLCYW